MINKIVLVGRLAEKVQIRELEEGKKVGVMKLSVPREYKNSDGVYETDLLECVVYGKMAENLNEFCQVGDLIGLKGRVSNISNDEKKSANSFEIVAEKVSFLQSRNKSKDNIEER